MRWGGFWESFGELGHVGGQVGAGGVGHGGAGRLGGDHSCRVAGGDAGGDHLGLLAPGAIDVVALLGIVARVGVVIVIDLLLVVDKAHLLWREAQEDGAGFAVAVFFYAELGHIGGGCAVGVGVEVEFFWTVDEGHDVGILLDGAGLAQVGEFGELDFLGARFDGSVELREGDDGYVEFFGGL